MNLDILQHRKRHNGDIMINSLPIQVVLEAAEPNSCRIVVNRAPSRTICFIAALHFLLKKIEDLRI